MTAELIEQLLIIQNRDQRLKAFHHELAAAPVERQTIEARLAQASEAVVTAKGKLQQLEIQRKKLEVDAQTKQDSIFRFKTQQQQTRKNEEYQALTHEIERFSKDIQAIEDEELEIMEHLETAKAGLAKAEDIAAGLRAAIQAQLATLDSKVAQLTEAKAQTEAERGALAAKVDDSVMSVYTRLIKSKGDSAVVALEHDTCTGCHMKVTTQTSHRVKAGKDLCHCEHCGRILYWGD